MGCEEIREYLSGYLDEDLDGETRARVEEHLAACEQCRKELGALKALVGELGSMETPRPPGDFLEQLHARLERPSLVSRILQKLFVPMRLKVPLELAGAVALVALVFSLLQVQEPQLRISKGLEGAEQGAPPAIESSREVGVGEAVLLRREEIAKPGPADRLEEQPKRKASAPRGGARTPLQVKKEGERRPAELVLMLKPRQGAVMQAPKAAVEALGQERPETGKPLAMDEVRAPTTPGKALPLSEVKSIIELLGGKVISVEQERGPARAQVLYGEIPWEASEKIVEKLESLGDLEAFPKAKTGKERDVLRVRIRILPPE